MNKVQPHAKYRPGDVVTLKAVRASEMGVFLDAGTGNTDDDILLHKLQQETEVKVGDSVKVYLYLDPSRPARTPYRQHETAQNA